MASAFFASLQRWWTSSKIKSLEAALHGQPTPALYLQLAAAHQAAGNSQRAAQVLKLGAARFPRALEVVRRHAEAERAGQKIEKQRLLEKIQNQPNPILYARLAEIFKAHGELDKTIETCQKGLKAFPQYGGTYLVLGQLYVEKKQWAEAAAKLEKSIELDKYNYLALKLLAQVYVEMGRPADAAKRLEDILYFAPGDEAALELLKKAREKIGKPAAAPEEVKARAPSSRRPLPAASDRMPAAEQRDKRLDEGLAGLRSVPGVTGALLMDQYGLVLAAGLAAGFDEGLAAALITNVYRIASGNAAKLGVGQFEESLLEGEQGNVHIARIEEMILAVFARPEVKPGLLEKGIRDFAAVMRQHS